ncbi:MAG: non-ribosomal peptide synthetase, partial [Candidatus Binatia bacterium]
MTQIGVLMESEKLTERLATLSPAKRALLELKLQQGRGRTAAQMTVPRRAQRGSAPLSFAQQRLWFLDQLEPESFAYNERSAVRLDGPLDIGALRSALSAIVERHEVLRTTYGLTDGGEPVQQIGAAVGIDLPVIDISEVAESQRDDVVQRIAAELRERSFDLRHDMPLRLSLVKLGANSHVLVEVKHHIASDGWSSGIFSRELAAIYSALSQGRPNPLGELPVQYADYSLWQREWLQGEVLEKQLAYWKEQLKDIPVLELAMDWRRGGSLNRAGAKQSATLSKSLVDRLKALSRQEGATLFMTLLTAFYVLLHRYTGQDDIAVGSPIAGRTRSETEGLIGFFVNTLVLRSKLSGNPTFKELLAQVRETALQAYEHQDVPFEKLVEELKPERDQNRTPFVQVMFALQNVPRGNLEMAGLKATPVDVASSGAKFDIFAAFIEREGEMMLRVEYSTELFAAAWIERMLGHFQTLLEGIVASPNQRISELPLLTQAEKHQLLVVWNDTKRDYPSDKCIHQLFEEQVKKSPDAVALAFQGDQLTYRQLNSRANRLAHSLRNQGVGPDVLVAICVERSVEMVIGLLGILKAGGAYVPLDPAYPKDRIAYILKDTQASIVLTEKRLLEDLGLRSTEISGDGVGCSDSQISVHESHLTVICLDRDWKEISGENRENLRNQTTPANLAYLIYTSGSTGLPKGVMIEHRNAVAFLSWAHSVFTKEELAGVIASTSICFDLSIFELFAPLTSGGRVILIENALALSDLDPGLEPTLINSVPSVMIELLRLRDFPASIRTVNLAGEPLKTSLVQAIHERTAARRVYDLYGPSETTTYSTYALRTAGGLQTIGRPIANTQVYILDLDMNPVPIGVVGELHIGGDGLARGYLDRPELTAEKFHASPLISNGSAARLYKTGDRARYLPDGNIEFLGRIDNQVKIRGYRIELGEIEAVLDQHRAVQSSMVVVREDVPEDKRLVGYVVARSKGLFDAAEVRNYLKQKLPEYMIPSAFVRLDELPLTPNGKVDRRALPVPDQSRPEPEESYVAPRTVVEKLVAGIWAEVLKVEKAGIHDNFFDLGGHSLLGIKVISQLRRKLGVDLPVRTLFEAPTIAQLAARFERQTKPVVSSNEKATYSHLIELRSGPNQKPIFCFPYRCGVQGEYTHFLRLAKYMEEYSFYGLQAKAADSHTPPHASVEELASNYVREIEDFHPNGPYYLIGDCAGAPEAYETARQLSMRGEKVGLLVLLDAKGPYMPGRYWRLGPYSIKDLDLLRSRLLSSRFWMWCRNLDAASSFHWQESRKLPNGERWRYLGRKVFGGLKTQIRASQKYTSEPSQESEEVFSASEEELLQHVARARSQYRGNWPNDYRGRLAVIINAQWYGFDRTFGWAEMAAGGVETYAIRGDHISYMLENVPMVA